MSLYIYKNRGRSDSQSSALLFTWSCCGLTAYMYIKICYTHKTMKKTAIKNAIKNQCELLYAEQFLKAISSSCSPFWCWFRLSSVSAQLPEAPGLHHDPWGLREALSAPSTFAERKHSPACLQRLTSREVSMTAPSNGILKSDNQELSPLRLFGSPGLLFKKHINYGCYSSLLTSLSNGI